MANISGVLSNVFFGTEQSKYAAIAYFITIVIICFAVLFANSDVPIEQRLLVVFFILVITIPSVLFSLFELTCIVTGGNRNTRWWCYWLAWFLSIMLIIYCVFIIISLFFSMASYDLAVNRINDDEENNKVSKADANEYAKEIMKKYDEDKKNIANQPYETMQVQQAQPQQSQAIQAQHQPMQSQAIQALPQQSQAMQAQPMAQIKPMMSNDFQFGTMGYDKDDNFAPISNDTNMLVEAYSEPNKPVIKEMYLNNQSQMLKGATDNVPDAFSMDDNLQPY